MEEVSELTKKDSEESKKGGSGSDNEKSPPPTAAAAANPEPMEDVEATTKPKEPKSEAPPDAEEMDIESDQPPAAASDSKVEPSRTAETETEPAAESVAKPKTVASAAENDAMDVDPEEDFVVVESGGEGDQLAQEKAAAKEKGKNTIITKKSEDTAKEGKGGVSAGAQPPNNADSVVASEPIAEMKGNFTPTPLFSALFRTF